MATYDTWNPSDKAAGIALTLSNLKATSSSTYSAVRGAMGKATGKWYFEITINVVNTGGGGMGKAAAGLTSLPGTDANGWVFLDSGVYNNNVLAFAGTLTTNDVINVAVDIGAGNLWFGKNGTYVNSGDPAAGTGAAFTGLSGTFYPIAGGGNTTAVTANFGATAFTGTVPSGFGAGWFTPTSTSMTADPGAYTLTGFATTLGRLFSITATAGSYAITGASITIQKMISIVATAGSYSITGAAATIGRSLIMAINAGSYAISGASASLLRGYLMTTTAGSYAITGIPLVVAVVAATNDAIRKVKFVLQKLRTQDPTLDQ